ncbi:hypothetical protein [Pseudomonas asplenii]|uniref:hypothetical protein n=1 Tax=Pseudomonas asplenii TaxID=53407 RepID=UPI0006B464EB|nr:hypothetical protein [Pseudomonas fuscovaginae]KPA98239.1 hypothetical protein PF70_01637 [Pseudomonas fuscovaginae]
MKRILGFTLLLIAVQVKAQTVEVEMTKLKQLADSCTASLPSQSCSVTSVCEVFESYSNELMPDGAPGYYEMHGKDKSMTPGNGKLVSDAVTAAFRAKKALRKCSAS